MPDPLVLYDIDDKVAVITLNRPDKLNAISAELQRQLTDAFAGPTPIPRPASCCCAPTAAASAPATTFRRGSRARTTGAATRRKAHAHLHPQLEFEMLPWLMKKPVVASVQGHVMGGGCELVMLCDLTIAADNATFGEPEVRFSSVGPALVMPMIIGYKKARELLYFGDTIDARAALDLGMVNRVVPLAELREASLRYAKRLSLISPEALYAAKRAHQPRRRRRGFPHRALRRPRHPRPALRNQDRIRPAIPRHRRRRRRPRRRQVAIGAIPRIKECSSPPAPEPVLGPRSARTSKPNIWVHGLFHQGRLGRWLASAQGGGTMRAPDLGG